MFDKPIINPDWLALIGRVTLSLIFILGGFGKITGFAGSVAYAASAGMPFPELGIVVAILIEFVGGIMLLVGYKARWAALALAVLIVPINYYFHADFAQQLQMTMFMKNVAILGGMLMAAAHGAGKFSVDAWMMKKPVGF